MSKLSGQATTLLDAVDWDDQANTFAIWHCGPTAVSWADGPTKLLPHNVDGRTAEGVPASGLPGIVDMDFAPGQVTLIRTLGALDDEFVLEGEIICTPERHICGSFGTVAKATAYGRQVTPAEIRETILMRSLPHHYTAAHGHVFS
jgi:L-fucose isomerase-like protein